MTDIADYRRPTAKPRLRMWVSLLLAAIIVAAVFFAYGQPELLLEAVGLRYCG